METNFAMPSFAPVEQKLVDFSTMERKGNVILKPLRSKKSTDGKDLNSNIVSFRGFRDPNTDTWYGIPIGRNQDGTFKFKRIVIDGHRHYNLALEQDAKEWHVVRHHQCICADGNPSRNHFFIVIDTERDADKKVTDTLKAVDAIQFINDPKLTEVKIRDFARLFGIDTMNNSYIVIKSLLFEKAMTKPEYFMGIVDNEEERDIMVVIKRALATGIITMTPDKGYMFKNSIPLGSTEGAIVNTFRKDRTMMVHVDMESKQKDRFYVAEEKEKKAVEPVKAPTATLGNNPSASKQNPAKATIAENFEVE